MNECSNLHTMLNKKKKKTKKYNIIISFLQFSSIWGIARSMIAARKQPWNDVFERLLHFCSTMRLCPLMYTVEKDEDDLAYR